MPHLAIVIGAVGSIESLEGTLVSILENRPADCEILVALNQPYDDPYDLRGEVRLVEAPRRSRFVDCLNRAIAATRSPFIHLLATGCAVSDGWTEPALARFGDRRVASVAPVVVDGANAGQILAAGLAYYKSGRRVLVAHGEAEPPAEMPSTTRGPCWFAGFYRKAALEMIGGLSKELGLAQADADVARALAIAGWTSVLEPQSRVVADAPLEPSESAFRRALYEERLFWRNLPAARRLPAVATHAGLLAVETIRNFPRLAMLQSIAGRALACAQIGSYVRRHTILRQWAQHRGTAGHRESTRIDCQHPVPSSSASNRAARKR